MQLASPFFFLSFLLNSGGSSTIKRHYTKLPLLDGGNRCKLGEIKDISYIYIKLTKKEKKKEKKKKLVKTRFFRKAAAAFKKKEREK
jgi:hypothetical protein